MKRSYVSQGYLLHYNHLAPPPKKYQLGKWEPGNPTASFPIGMYSCEKTFSTTGDNREWRATGIWTRSRVALVARLIMEAGGGGMGGNARRDGLTIEGRND